MIFSPPKPYQQKCPRKLKLMYAQVLSLHRILVGEQVLVHPPVQLVKYTRVKSGNRSERTKLC